MIIRFLSVSNTQNKTLDTQAISLLADWIISNDRSLIPKLKQAFPEFITKDAREAFRGVRLLKNSPLKDNVNASFTSHSFSFNDNEAREFARIKKPRAGRKIAKGDYGVLYKVKVQKGALDIQALMTSLVARSKSNDPALKGIFDWRDEPWVWQEDEILGDGIGKAIEIYVTPVLKKELNLELNIKPFTVEDKGQFYPVTKLI